MFDASYIQLCVCWRGYDPRIFEHKWSKYSSIQACQQKSIRFTYAGIKYSNSHTKLELKKSDIRKYWHSKFAGFWSCEFEQYSTWKHFFKPRIFDVRIIEADFWVSTTFWPDATWPITPFLCVIQWLNHFWTFPWKIKTLGQIQVFLMKLWVLIEPAKQLIHHVCWPATQPIKGFPALICICMWQCFRVH